MNRAPRVSVVIPTYNRASLVCDAINSVLGQSFHDLEIIVCDDGSTDDTAARVQSFGSTVRYLRLEHAGRAGPPRNRGIEAARGELVAFLDDDDLWEPDKLARQLALLSQEPGLGLIYTDRRLLHADGSQSKVARTPSPPASGELLDLLVTGHAPCVCTVLVSSGALRRTGGFDETLDYAGEELDLWFRLARVVRSGRVAEPLAIIRREAPGRKHPTGPLTNAITVFQRQLDAGDLRMSQRLRCHAVLSHLNVELCVNLARSGDRRGARHAALRALRHRPVSARAWQRAAGTWLTRA